MKKVILWVISILIVIVIGFMIFYFINNGYESYAGAVFNTKYRGNLVITQTEYTTNLYQKINEYPYITVNRYLEYQTTDECFSFIDEAVNDKTDLTKGPRSFTTIGTKIVETRVYTYKKGDNTITDTKYVFMEKNKAWVISTLEMGNTNIYELLTDVITNFEAK